MSNLKNALDWDCIFVSTSLKLMEVRYRAKLMMITERLLVQFDYDHRIVEFLENTRNSYSFERS